MRLGCGGQLGLRLPQLLWAPGRGQMQLIKERASFFCGFPRPPGWGTARVQVVFMGSSWSLQVWLASLSFHIWVLPWPPALLAYSKVMPTSRQQSQASHEHFTRSHHHKTSSAHKSRHALLPEMNPEWYRLAGCSDPVWLTGGKGLFHYSGKQNSKW